eukprot:5356159-Ditylum_brightwellii.AAC.1
MLVIAQWQRQWQPANLFTTFCNARGNYFVQWHVEKQCKRLLQLRRTVEIGWVWPLRQLGLESCNDIRPEPSLTASLISGNNDNKGNSVSMEFVSISPGQFVMGDMSKTNG